MYSPVKDGIEKTAHSVRYIEAKPPSDLSGFVHNFWELKTAAQLPEDFRLHVLPDACVNILFNLSDTNIAAVTARQTTYTVLNLGKTFHYAGVQLLPGVWQGNRDELMDGFVGTPYSGSLPLVETAKKLIDVNFTDKQKAMSTLVRQLIAQKLVAPNDITAKILANVQDIHAVTDMAAVVDLSPRQLQRVLKQTTGFSPHDFLKVVRLQYAFKQGHGAYTDQSHFIHSFRKSTGYTPATYDKKFNV